VPNDSHARFFGIDVAKQHLDLADPASDQSRRFDNTDDGIQCLVQHLLQHTPALVVVESTGKLESPLVSAMLEADIPVARVDPKRVRQFAYGLGTLAKTDPIDARLLARYAQVAQPHLTQKRDANRTELAELITCRRQLIESRVAHNNQLATTHAAFARKTLRTIVQTLNKRVAQLDKRIHQIIDDDDDLNHLDRLLKSVKGVGPVLAATLISQLPELGKIDHPQLAALVGLAPYNRDSGNTQAKRSIRGGRTAVRNVLYVCTVAAVRTNPMLKQAYLRLRELGKPPKVALVATARKLLRILNAIVRDNQPWQQKQTTQPCKTIQPLGTANFAHHRRSPKPRF
jgi:transposase